MKSSLPDRSKTYFLNKKLSWGNREIPEAEQVENGNEMAVVQKSLSQS